MSLLNNRQPGRRRGRTGGQRPQGNGGRGQEQGNRIDNRARGNAPQMLEKYKALARDAQMQGDRVITEYYLQFADHYFRVVAETRSRQEETRRQRDDWQGDDNDPDMGEGDDLMTADAGDQDDDQAAAERAYEAQRRQPRQQRDNQPRDNQPRDNQPRDNLPRDNQRDSQQRDTRPRDTRSRDNQGQDGDDGYRQNRQPRRDGRDSGGYEAGQRDSSDRNNQTRRVFAQTRAEAEPATIDVSVLPPAFGSDGPVMPIADLVDMADVTNDPAPKRRGRPKKVAVESDVA